MKVFRILVLCTLLFSSCVFNLSFGNGGVNVIGKYSEQGDFSEARTVPFFDSFKTSGPFNVYFIQSDQHKVLVEGKEEFVKKLKTEVRDKTLAIFLEKGTYRNLALKVTVYSPSIEDIASAGSGNIVCENINLPQQDIEFALAGSGDLILGNICCKDLDLATAGSGDVLIKSGAVLSEDAEFLSAGSGDIKVESIKCRELEIKIAGSGDAYVRNAEIVKDVELGVSGSGDIVINGSCMELEASVRGSGDISGKMKYSRIETHSVGSGKIRL